MDEVTDEPLYRDRVCGIDIGKAVTGSWRRRVPAKLGGGAGAGGHGPALLAIGVLPGRRPGRRDRLQGGR